MTTAALTRTPTQALSVDLLDLYETIGTAATTITMCADSIYAAHLMGARPWLPFADAKSAAQRVLTAIAEYERQVEMGAVS